MKYEYTIVNNSDSNECNLSVAESLCWVLHPAYLLRTRLGLNDTYPTKDDSIGNPRNMVYITFTYGYAGRKDTNKRNLYKHHWDTFFRTFLTAEVFLNHYGFLDHIHFDTYGRCPLDE
jgi:hypothetical protein